MAMETMNTLKAFLRYCFRKTGVGRTQWWMFVFIRLGGAALFVYGGFIVFGDKDPWGWPVLGICSLIYGGFLYFTYKNFKVDKAREEKGPNNELNHHKELWDGAAYVCMHGLKPSKHTHKCAWPIAHDLDKFPDEPTAQERAIRYDP